MKLLDYLKEREETIADFAARLRESENTIRKIAYGQRQPSLPLSVKITDATEGAVGTPDMLLSAA